MLQDLSPETLKHMSNSSHMTVPLYEDMKLHMLPSLRAATQVLFLHRQLWLFVARKLM